MAVNALYAGAADVSQSFTFDEETLEAALKRIYGREYDVRKVIDRDLFEAIRSVFSAAIKEGFGNHIDHDAEFYNALRYNTDVFSAFKVHRLQNDVAGQLLDEKGMLKSFESWIKDTEDMVSHHVYSWLETEYSTAVTRAHQAADWRQFERERDILPNLRWNPSTSAIPGQDHIIFWNRIWSIDDDFWSRHRPGDRWGCKCSLSSTDEPETDNSYLQESSMQPAPGLKGNPGETAELFSKDHPYIANAYKGADKAVRNLMAELYPNREQFTERRYKSGGVLQMPQEFRQNSAEQRKNIRAYTELVRLYGEHYRLLSVINEHGRKNPDALNLKTGYFSDVKNPETVNGKNAIQASIRTAARQKVDEVYIFLSRPYRRSDIYKGLLAALHHGRAATIKTIIVRFEDGTLKRYNATKLRGMLKK